MDDGLVVQVDERVQHLRHARQGFHLTERAMRPDDGLQVFAGDVIHHQILPLTRDEEVINDARDVRVAQLIEQLRLLDELLLRPKRGFQAMAVL
ncbi:MAG TPA: hypothetical protein PKH77_28410 [Anaerolineae bacterium]|nr:hypothetical protein [Anaerolineae bacterium]